MDVPRTRPEDDRVGLYPAVGKGYERLGGAISRSRGMKTYEVPMQESGRVILPSELRQALGLQKGDRVLIEADGDSIVLTTARLRRRRAQALVARHIAPGGGVVDEFLAEKRADAAREAREVDDGPGAAGGGA